MSKEKALTVSWNKDYVKSVKREDFIKAHLHLADEKILGEEYDKIVPKKA